MQHLRTQKTFMSYNMILYACKHIQNTLPSSLEALSMDLSTADLMTNTLLKEFRYRNGKAELSARFRRRYCCQNTIGQ